MRGRSAPPPIAVPLAARGRDTPRLKVALITRRYPPLIGGAEKVLSYLAPALAAEGADVTVLTSGVAGHPGSEETVAAPGRLRVVRLATARTRFVGTWLYMRSLAHWLARHPIDLAYVSMLKHDAYVAVEAGRRRRFPVVLRPEGAGATGDLAWQSWGRFGRSIGRRCRLADAFVSISDAITRELRDAGYDPGRIHPLPNGVPIPDRSWDPRPGWQSAPRAVFVGRLAAEKGLATLVSAWPVVRDRHPGARLTLVGDGPERPALEATIARLRLEDAVVLAGPADHPEARLRDADLFVLPSFEEGMSIALLEAMALGMPLVASAIPGNRLLVTDEGNPNGDGDRGRLAPPGDPEALARAILAQWADFDAARRMGRAAREHVIDRYSIASVARRHLALFESLIRRGNVGEGRARGGEDP